MDEDIITLPQHGTKRLLLTVENLGEFLDPTRQKVDKPSEQAAITKPVNRSKLDN